MMLRFFVYAATEESKVEAATSEVALNRVSLRNRRFNGIVTHASRHFDYFLSCCFIKYDSCGFAHSRHVRCVLQYNCNVLTTTCLLCSKRSARWIFSCAVLELYNTSLYIRHLKPYFYYVRIYGCLRPWAYTFQFCLLDLLTDFEKCTLFTSCGQHIIWLIHV